MIPDGILELKRFLHAKARMTLITGSTTQQGIIMRGGKKIAEKEEYMRHAGVCFLNEEDMRALDISEGEHVKLKTNVGEITLSAQKREQPQGIAFAPKSPWINSIIDSGTGESGSPDYKGMDVEVEYSGESVLDVDELMKKYVKYVKNKDEK